SHRASRDACEIRLKPCLLHPQSEPLADLTVCIKNTNLADLVPQVDADVERELLFRSVLRRNRLLPLTLFFRLLLAVILFHSWSPFCTSSAFHWELIASRWSPASRFITFVRNGVSTSLR